VRVGQGLRATLLEKLDDGSWRIRPEDADGLSTEVLLERHGRIPLPPYIRKGLDSPEDRQRYQTIFAQHPGSVAAPTAGLHFTPDVMDRLSGRGIEAIDVTLHVGIGTFRPIEAEQIDEHKLHAEQAEVTAAVADRLNHQRARGGRIIAVGTTATRTLETSARSGRFEPFRGETALYIKPGFHFQAIDGLITNFHLPRSSLIVLVSALAGYELTRRAYATAIEKKYRFYSYGDAMLIL
jgi:S-adenosylmethionine:tRNA ribosyltransferase-isomerase